MPVAQASAGPGHNQSERTVILKTDELRSLQAPLKEQYRESPDAALVTLRAQARLGEDVSCKIETHKALVTAGVHPPPGGTGQLPRSRGQPPPTPAACAGVGPGAGAAAPRGEIAGAGFEAEGGVR